MRKYLKWLGFAGLWLACAALMYFTLPPAGEDGMAAVFPFWNVFRTVALGLALAAALVVVAVLFRSRKTILSFMPGFRKYQPLLKLLVRRDFFVRYQRSVLGILWTLLNPLANMIIMSIVFSYLFRNTIPNFPAFVLSGTVVFGCFSEATNNALQSVVGRAPLLKKVYVPKYIFPFSAVVTAFLNMLFALLALLIVMLVTGAPFHIQMVMMPLIFVYLFVFCLGTGLLLATMQVFFRDTAHLYGVILTAMNYLSAIFYDINIVPVKYMPFFAVNPMYHFVSIFRKVALNGEWPRMWDHMVCAGIAVAAILLGASVFYKKQDQFILHI